MQFEESKNLAAITTFGIGGNARFFVEVQTIEKLQATIRYCFENQLRYIVIGKGSNTLFDDRGFNGLVILNKICFCKESEGEFFVGAGYSFSLLGAQSARKGWEGLEFASGIPGSVGGAVYMNAGANGGETFDCLKEVTFVKETGDIDVVPKESLTWGYRFSSFHDLKGAIGAAKFVLKPSLEARKKQLKIIDYRTKTQPYGDLSAGCVFRNSKTKSAGSLIEECGLKGVKIGGAAVSILHANFIINAGGATAQEVLQLAKLVQETVKEKTGEELEMEVRVVPYS